MTFKVTSLFPRYESPGTYATDLSKDSGGIMNASGRTRTPTLGNSNPISGPTSCTSNSFLAGPGVSHVAPGGLVSPMGACCSGGPGVPSGMGTSLQGVSGGIRSGSGFSNTGVASGLRQSNASSLSPSLALPNLGASDIGRTFEQGRDFLIELDADQLSVYGPQSLKFLDRPWNRQRALRAMTVQFNFVSFDDLVPFLPRFRQTFPNVENFEFVETDIRSMGQLNALALFQGITSLVISSEGNPITSRGLWSDNVRITFEAQVIPMSVTLHVLLFSSNLFYVDI